MNPFIQQSSPSGETDLIFYNMGGYIAIMQAVFIWEGEQVQLVSNDVYALQSVDFKIYPGVDFVQFAVYVCVFPGIYKLRYQSAYTVDKPKKCYKLTGAVWNPMCNEIACPSKNPFPDLNIGTDLTTFTPNGYYPINPCLKWTKFEEYIKR